VSASATEGGHNFFKNNFILTWNHGFSGSVASSAPMSGGVKLYACAFDIRCFYGLDERRASAVFPGRTSHKATKNGDSLFLNVYFVSALVLGLVSRVPCRVIGRKERR